MGTDALIERCAELPGPRLIVIEDLEPKPQGAIFGEVLSNVFRSADYVGLITNAACRDVHELQALGWPCWGAGVMAGFHGGGYFGCLEPVTVGGMPIASGDLLHADANGVVSVPAERVAMVCELAPRYDQIEKLCVSRMRDEGASPSQALGELRKAMSSLRSAIAQASSR
jgi:regulator of RNase E activity RraA